MVVSAKKSALWVKILLIGFVIASFLVGNLVFFPYQIPNNSYRLVVEKNESISDISEDLYYHDVIKSKFMFRKLLQLLRKDRKVAAGLYLLKDSMSTWQIVERITNGKPDQISITIVDGLTFKQIKSYIDDLSDIKHLTNNYTEQQLASALKINLNNLEGVFYPSTYFIAPNQTDLEIYQQAYKLMQNKLSALYATRSTSAFYTSPYQMLIMASLIQKETANKADMVLVSTVFNNRLRKGMKLQDDPSVFYGLRSHTTVSRKDFQIDTPYNTYLRYGLPPTPICTPSADALLAASKPINNPDLLYFLAVGSGRTKFSKTYKEHKVAISHYLEHKPLLTHQGKH